MRSSRSPTRTGTPPPRRTSSTSTTDRVARAKRPSIRIGLPTPVAGFHEIVRDHERWRLQEAINLQPSENVMSEEARALLASDFAHRYTLPTRYAPGLGEA